MEKKFYFNVIVFLRRSIFIALVACTYVLNFDPKVGGGLMSS